MRPVLPRLWQPRSPVPMRAQRVAVPVPVQGLRGCSPTGRRAPKRGLPGALRRRGQPPLQRLPVRLWPLWLPVPLWPLWPLGPLGPLQAWRRARRCPASGLGLSRRARRRVARHAGSCRPCAGRCGHSSASIWRGSAATPHPQSGLPAAPHRCWSRAARFTKRLPWCSTLNKPGLPGTASTCLRHRRGAGQQQAAGGECKHPGPGPGLAGVRRCAGGAGRAGLGHSGFSVAAAGSARDSACRAAQWPGRRAALALRGIGHWSLGWR